MHPDEPTTGDVRRGAEGAAASPVNRRAASSAFVVALPAIVVFLLHALAHRPVFVDDAYIFYRYASNWAAGYGLVYNPGEYVEGYSSLLWTVLLAIGAGLSIPPDVLAPVLGALLGITCLVLLAYAARHAVPDSTVVALALPLACSASTGFAYYAVSGMDTILFAAVLLATLVAALTSTSRGGTAALAVCLALLVFVRAEGFLYALTILVVLGATRGRDLRQPVSSWRGYGWVVAVTWAAILLQFGGRRLLYGDWMPATVSAKAYTTFALQAALGSSSHHLRPVLDALGEGIRYEGFVAPLAVVPGLVLLWHALRRRPVPVFAALLAGSVLVNMAVTIWAAGDWMDYHRHIVPVWPAWLLLLAWGLRQASDVLDLRPRLASAVVAVAVLSAGWHAVEEAVGPPTLGSVVPDGGRSLYKRQVGTLLHEFGAPVTVVTNVAGKMPYYAGPRTYARDLMGLTDEHNAKHGTLWSPTYGRTDYDYSFGRPFDLLVTNSYADLEALLGYWDAHPDAGHEYALYAAEAWTANCFFVVAKPHESLGARLQQLCGCQPRPLDASVLERIRAVPLCSGVGGSK